MHKASKPSFLQKRKPGALLEEKRSGLGPFGKGLLRENSQEVPQSTFGEGILAEEEGKVLNEGKVVPT